MFKPSLIINRVVHNHFSTKAISIWPLLKWTKHSSFRSGLKVDNVQFSLRFQKSASPCQFYRIKINLVTICKKHTLQTSCQKYVTPLLLNIHITWHHRQTWQMGSCVSCGEPCKVHHFSRNTTPPYKGFFEFGSDQAFCPKQLCWWLSSQKQDNSRMVP